MEHERHWSKEVQWRRRMIGKREIKLRFEKEEMKKVTKSDDKVWYDADDKIENGKNGHNDDCADVNADENLDENFGEALDVNDDVNGDVNDDVNVEQDVEKGEIVADVGLPEKYENFGVIQSEFEIAISIINESIRMIVDAEDEGNEKNDEEVNEEKVEIDQVPETDDEDTNQESINNPLFFLLSL